jgi:hypothetical protein
LRPSSGDQLFLAENLTGAFNQSGENVEGPAAAPYRRIPLKQEALRCREPERAKRKAVLAARRR